MLRLIPAMMLAGLVATGCSSEGTPGCQEDVDCPSGFFCRGGECLFDCANDGDCPEGYRCTPRGRCEPGCAITNGGVEICDGV